MKSFQFITKEPVCKGWSGDQKYRVATADGAQYLLRIAPKAKGSRLSDMFRVQQQLAPLGIPMCQPVAIEEHPDGTYLLQTWIEGCDAEDVIPSLSDAEQYAYGLTAGQILQKIHSLPAPASLPDWATRFNAKIDRKIKLYQACPIEFEGAPQLLSYIQANRPLLSGRPQCLQHGDYHIGNMMIENHQLIIIDFDRFDFGDPWEEFNRIVWSAQAAPSFASGMVDGYFDGPVPLLFWQLLALYISSNTLSSIAWAVSYGDQEIATMRKQAHDVLSWYHDMQTPIPSWYRPRTT